jgi:hypothetical protein
MAAGEKMKAAENGETTTPVPNRNLKEWQVSVRNRDVSVGSVPSSFSSPARFDVAQTAESGPLSPKPIAAKSRILRPISSDWFGGEG